MTWPWPPPYTTPVPHPPNSARCQHGAKMRGQILMAAAGLVATGVADTTARVFGEGTVDGTNVILIEAESGTFKSPSNWEIVVHEGRVVIMSLKQMSRFQDLANVNMGVDTNLDTKDGIITYELDIETAGWWGGPHLRSPQGAGRKGQ